MSRLFFFFLCFWLSESNAISSERCINQNQKCDLHGNNLIQSQTGVTGPECQQLCEEITVCNVFTYFGEDSFPYQQVCMLFISCDTLDECEDCVTVNVKLDCSCGISYEGSINSENLVQIEEDVQTEQDCRSICSSVSSCSVYTYYDAGHVTDAALCLLLTALQDPVQSCENCQSGSDKCEAFEECRVGVWDGGDQFTVAKFIATESKTLKYVSGESGCYKMVNAVAVGSGGNAGEECFDRGGGGASGYINTTKTLLPTNAYILADIQNDGVGTFLTRQDTGEILLSAANGTPDTLCYNGGNGYSGGGGGGSSSGSASGADGGSDGKDGINGYFPGGNGSGFNMSSISMNYFKLSVGNGGKHQEGNGGGGGGLLVDGSGPNNGFIAGVGEGYGGGGGVGNVSGSPGCVILEL